MSVWDYKPWWCKPWSILLTGLVIIGGSWLLLHRIWVTGLVAVPILAWMGFFLLLYPRLMRDAEPDAMEISSIPTDSPQTRRIK
ncbi:MAG: hypothetical protein KME07_18210 [Pegethrix bostrychoides GSE-TBD4-15B]|jgi:hypothetical protein|uniref:DUF6737 domain-containing protein n=1 Tax=Pegethrix bostrychoides GSE-TBD4-15B TaxID=2839662 RepID=A0A951PFB6_9CYAN|nr:hypothetical protein [Pegethrix bostrychoides GSE-TBD4-15B]